MSTASQSAPYVLMTLLEAGIWLAVLPGDVPLKTFIGACFLVFTFVLPLLIFAGERAKKEREETQKEKAKEQAWIEEGKQAPEFKNQQMDLEARLTQDKVNAREKELQQHKADFEGLQKELDQTDKAAGMDENALREQAKQTVEDDVNRVQARDAVVAQIQEEHGAEIAQDNEKAREALGIPGEKEDVGEFEGRLQNVPGLEEARKEAQDAQEALREKRQTEANEGLMKEAARDYEVQKQHDAARERIKGRRDEFDADDSRVQAYQQKHKGDEDLGKAYERLEREKKGVDNPEYGELDKKLAKGMTDRLGGEDKVEKALPNFDERDQNRIRSGLRGLKEDEQKDIWDKQTGTGGGAGKDWEEHVNKDAETRRESDLAEQADQQFRETRDRRKIQIEKQVERETLREDVSEREKNVSAEGFWGKIEKEQEEHEIAEIKEKQLAKEGRAWTEEGLKDVRDKDNLRISVKARGAELAKGLEEGPSAKDRIGGLKEEFPESSREGQIGVIDRVLGRTGEPKPEPTMKSQLSGLGKEPKGTPGLKEKFPEPPRPSIRSQIPTEKESTLASRVEDLSQPSFTKQARQGFTERVGVDLWKGKQTEPATKGDALQKLRKKLDDLGL